MDEGYNVIQYVIPGNSNMCFDILSHARNIIVKLLSGMSDLHLNDRVISLQLDQEFPLPIWECLCPRLKTKTVSNLLIQGSHYVSLSNQEGQAEDTLFKVFESGDSYSFILDKSIQLEIYPIQYTKENVLIKIRNTRGTCEISDYKLSPRITYSLTPYSPILIKSYNDEPYSIYVEGLDRKIRLSMVNENYQMRIKAVREHIIARFLPVKKVKCTSPTILVLGPKNSGKTSFCQSIVNDFLEKKISPLYIDLNIQRNFALPGSLSLTEIKDRTESNGLDFEYSHQQMLHFGSAVFHPVNLRYYNFLIRKMGWMLSFHRRLNHKDSIAIIDTDGSVLKNGLALRRILMSFSIDLVVVIGEHDYYEELKVSSLRDVPSEFIPMLQTIEPQNDYFNSNYYQSRIKNYFYGSDAKPSTPNTCVVRFNCFSIYKISVSGSSRRGDDENLNDYSMERIACSLNTTDKLLAVSKAKSAEFLSMAEVKYYVCITKINISERTATMITPQSENFTGGILLMGHVLMFNS